MSLFSHCTNAKIQEKQICHADPDISNYNYAGLWEKFEDGWICNYWQFFDESEYEEIEILNDEDIIELDDSDYTEMNIGYDNIDYESH